MINKPLLLLVIICSFIPIVLAFQIYSVVDCTKQTDKNYKAWLDQGNKGNFNDMIGACNNIHSIILIVLLPTSPIIGIISYRMFM